MLSLYSTLSLRYLRRRWLRAVLIVNSIALGVMTLVATRALNQTMTNAGLAMLNPLAGTADLIVSNGEASPVDRALAAELAKVPGVAVALPRIFKKGKLADLDDAPVLLVGVDLEAEKKAEALHDQTGPPLWKWSIPSDLQKWVQALPYRELFALMNEARQHGFKALKFVVVGKELEAKLPPGKIQLGLRVPGQQGPAKVVRIGTVEGRGPLAMLGGDVIVFKDLAAAAELAGLKPEQVSRIDLLVEPGAKPERVKAAVAAVLRGRAEVHTPEEQNQIASNAMSGMQTGFSLSGWAALVVGLFLVYNALSVSVAERRHEIGVLLSVGATRGQIRALFGGEAALLGLAGSLLGIPLGLGLAYVLQPLVQAVLRDVFMTVEARGIELSPWVMAAALAAGVLTAVLACLLPAMTAAAEKPAEAVRRVPPIHTWRYRVVQAAVSLLLIGLGVAAIILRSQLWHRLGLYGGMSLVLIGALLAAPLLSAVFARLLQPLARRLFGIEARLAADNLVRSPQRTGLVIAALAAGVALVLQTAGTIRSNRQGLRDWVRDYIGADLIVMSGSPVGGSGPDSPLPTELADKIKSLAGVERALPISMLKHTFGETQIVVEAVPAADYVQVNEGRHTAGLELYRQLARTPDGAIVSENFAALYHIRAGDTVTLTSSSGPVRLRVLGKVVDYSWNHGTVIVNRDDYCRHWEDPKVNFFDVYLKPGVSAVAVQDEITRRFGAGYGLFVQRRQQLQESIDRIIEQLYSIAYALQVMVMLVAALGVVMAFLISVLQRRREMGLLRAIGASQVQVVYSVLAEAALVGVIGTVIGLAVGVPLEWFVLRVAFLEESGYLFAVHIPWLESLVIAAAALVLATLAGLGPALHAVRQRIPEAIAYE
jgi:putative ABC transport system permease protein